MRVVLREREKEMERPLEGPEYDEYSNRVLRQMESHNNFKIFLDIIFERLSSQDRSALLSQIIAAGYIINLPPSDVAKATIEAIIDVEAEKTLERK